MKGRIGLKLLAIVLAISVLFAAIPVTTLSAEVVVEEIYIQSVQLAQADSAEEAREILEAEGYIFVEGNLNEGTGEDGIWMGYKTTSDPTEAIYDMKLMNMNGGFTLTSMEEALSAQTDAFAQMATDLNYLMEEFVEAYEEESIAAQKAYKALNFFRVVAGETELAEENGLGYHIVNGMLSMAQLTEMLLLCDPTLMDSVIKILTTGIQIHNGNWIKKLSEMGPYDKETTYYEDEDEEEFKRRAEQLLTVLQMYSQAYNAMDLSGLIPDKLDDNFEAEYSGNEEKETLSAEDAAAKKMDEGRYKYYKVVFDEFAKYSYGPTETLKDFFCSLENDGSAKDLYPLISVLSDGEFAAMSYGCFLEVASGAFATSADFDTYDEVYASFTQEAQSVYLYHGVDSVLLNQDAIIGFTEEASRHMASTGELDFYEKENTAEATWETGKRVATLVGGIGLAAVAVSKIVTGVAMGVLTVATAVESVAVTKSALLLGIIKYGSVLGGLPAMLVVAAVTAVVALGFLIASVIIDEISGKIDWEDNPMPEYLYDVQEVSFSQSSVNDGIATEFMRKPVFKLYHAVKDCDGQVVDLNARSKDASQWIAMYVSYDRQGNDAKPIKSEDLLVQTGDGVTPDDYVPLTRFGEVVACNLNTWDEDDDVNGVYVFYKQDQTVSVDDGKTYYIYDVYLQSGESDTHCIELLKAAGYTPLNINLSPALTDDDVVFQDKVYTYIGYKTTTNKSSAIRDIRVVYGPAQGQIQLGAATYADCGSNGQVTLYATKYDTAGTALLAGGLICVDDASKAPKGHEPVCAMSGGPAVSLNADVVGNVYPMTTQTLLYFLPETTFTSGTKYVSDIAIIYYNEFNPTARPPMGNVPSLPSSADNYWKDYKTLGGLVKADTERVGYYTTYNPYRAVYDVKAALEDDLPTTFTFEGLGYVEWNKITCTYLPGNANFTAEYGTYEPILEDDMNGTLYVSGNPDGENVHVTDSNAMSKVQPLKASDILCDAVPKDKKTEYTAPTIPDNFSPVTNVFSNSKEAAELIMDRGKYKLKFYIAKSQTEKKYISGVYALDAMTLFRAYGGYESGIEAIDIPESSVLAQLANQGATNFCDATIEIKATNSDYSYLKFAYKRTDAADEALRDVFLYFNGFTADTPPKEMYRGNVKYTLICEIPYNLTAYDELPKPGIYLYGTTNKKAGNPITDLEISDCPFFDGYQTVRTYNGRSLWSEIYDYAAEQAAIHPITSWLTWNGADMYEELMEFFEFSSSDQYDPQENGNFYIHVKREGDSLEKQKPYVSKVYLSSRYYHVYRKATDSEMMNPVYNDLFDQGAEAVVTVDLNAGAGGDVVCLGYSFTADPAEAITDLWAYHEKNPPATLTKNGITYTLVKNLDLNVDAGGDYIYLYATTNAAAGKPIVSLSADYEVKTGNGTKTWVDGTQIATTTKCVKRWGTNSYSDLNRRAGGEYVYLMFTSVDSSVSGTYKAPNYGKDKTYSRSGYTGKKADGKYIGGLYVMDKNTILQEKIAAGLLPKGSTCDRITKDEVIARLTKMGATTILDTPILTTGNNYYKNNKNEVYIGYSRTDTLKQALRGIALKAVVTSEGDPPETMDTDDGSYKLVAESASGVTTLPRAVNLIGLDNCQDLMLPRLYLYTSTTVDNDPIYDISIDDIPIKNGWLTARSGNNLDPFADIYAQAEALSDMAYKDNHENPKDQINVYSLDLYFLFSDFAEYFNPAAEEISTFYIHTKHYVNATLEELKPYIGEVFVAEGDTRYEALSQMVQYGVDGFIDIDLNQKAGGNYVYLGYKRTEKEKDAITDLVVFEGKNPDASKRITINGKSVKYTLVSAVDLNSDAGGKYLYLYYSDSDDTGNPITDLRVEQSVVSHLLCGVEQTTVKLAKDKTITDENIDLNKGAGGDYLYLVMTRESEDGHYHLKGTGSKEILPTCGTGGSLTQYYVCMDCNTEIEKLVETYEPTGKHTDKEGDGDHKCDVCKAKNVSAHVPGEVEKESTKKGTCVEKGSYHAVVYCVECEDELRNTVLYTDIDPDNHKDGSDADHNCDRCGKENIEDHTAAKAVKEIRVEAAEGVEGSYAMVVYCKECKEKLSEEIFVIDALPVTKEEESEVVGSVFSNGSVIAVGAFAGVAILAAILGVVAKKKKKTTTD